ncbi:MAG: hypothetical protein R6U32_02780 [Candidatus Woesearchaeota archaeon]
MKEIIKIIFACIAIIAGLAAIIKVAGNAELIITFLSLTFGVMAIIWTLMAHSSLSPGSSLRSYTSYFLACLVFILIYSLWDSAAKMLSIKGSWQYLSYLFLTLAYIVFVTAAYKIYYLGREFGFQKEADKIKSKVSKKNNEGK